MGGGGGDGTMGAGGGDGTMGGDRGVMVPWGGGVMVP